MTSRERLLAVLNGHMPDRVPVSPFVQEEYLSWYYPDREKIRRLEEAVDCARELDFDVMVRGKDFEIPHFMKKSFPNWELNSYERVDSENLCVIFEIKTPKRTLRQIEAGPNLKRGVSGIHRSTIEYLIKDEADFEAFSEFVPRVDSETVNSMKDYAVHAREVIGDSGICVPWGWAGVYNQAATYRNVEELMVDPYLNPAFYSAYLEKLTELMIEYNSILAGCVKDAIGIQGNIANGGIIGKDYFDEFILPYEKKLVHAMSERNIPTVYHNCGKAQVLLDSYVDMGLTAWETIAEHPQGDNSLEMAKRSVGDRLVLIGNLDQVNFIKTASAKQIEERVERIVAMGKPGGKYIFACSDFLEINTPVENVKAAISAAKKVGVYQ